LHKGEECTIQKGKGIITGPKDLWLGLREVGSLRNIDSIFPYCKGGAYNSLKYSLCQQYVVGELQIQELFFKRCYYQIKVLKNSTVYGGRTGMD